MSEFWKNLAPSHDLDLVESENNKISLSFFVKKYTGLVSVIVREILHKEQKQMQRDSVIKHEAGHALLLFLFDQYIEKIHIPNLMNETRHFIIRYFWNKYFWEWFNLNSWHIISEVNLFQFKTQYYMLIYVAWIANSQNSEFECRLMNRLDNAEKEDWDDIKIPFLYIKSNTGLWDIEAKSILKNNVQELRNIFESDFFSKSLKIIYQIIDKWTATTETIRHGLSEQFSENEIVFMRNSLDCLNFSLPNIDYTKC